MVRIGGIVAMIVTALWLSPSPSFGQDRPPANHALVIGINVSGSPIQGVPRLSYAVDDARRVAELLDAAGYEVVELIDDIARRENVVSELQRLAFSTEPHDSVLIYFAGHGVRQQVGNGEYSYWLTYDATLSKLDVNAIRLTHLLDYVNDIPAKRKLLVLDHCHSGDVAFTSAALEGSRDPRGLIAVSPESLFSQDDFRAQVESVVAEGLLVLGAATDKAYELPELGHGILTSVFIDALTTSDADTDGNDELTLMELRTYLLPKIADLAETNQVIQTPIVVERGTNLDWTLAALTSDAGLDELEPLLGNLEAHGQLAIATAMRCYEAVENGRSGSADAIDDKIIEQLKGIHSMGPGQWDRKSRMLKNFVDALTSPP